MSLSAGQLACFEDLQPDPFDLGLGLDDEQGSPLSVALTHSVDESG